MTNSFDPRQGSIDAKAASPVAGRPGLESRQPALDAGQRVFLRKQVAVSIAINALIPTVIIWAIGVSPPQALLGDHAVLPGMILASGLATLLMTVGLTFVVRAKLREGAFAPLLLSASGALSRGLPAHLLLRCMCMGALAVAVLVPCGIAVLLVLGLLPLGPRGFIAWNLLYGAAVGLLMTPLVVRRAMADPAARP